jgi:hypothetical protein
MSNFKKFSAAAVALAMTVTSLAPVFADTANVVNGEKAKVLNTLDLYAGTNPNTFEPALEAALTRGQGAILLTKLFNMDSAAMAMTDEEADAILKDFKDASKVSSSAKKRLAYLVEQGIMSGSKEANGLYLNDGENLKGGQFATLILKQMGFNVEHWYEAIDQLAEVEGAEGIAAYAAYGQQGLLRDHAVGIMYGALKAEYANGMKTIIEKIVESKPEIKEAAERAGLIAAPVAEELDVVSVKALNNKQLEVVFNQEMDKDSAQDKDLYTIKDKGETNKTLTEDSVVLGDDKKTVTITLDSSVLDSFTNSSTAKVIIDGDIMAANEKTLGKDKEFSVEIQDGILPTVEEVKATGEKNIKITFSEPVLEGGTNSKTLTNSTFAVKSGTYTYYVSNAELDLNVINLTLGTKLIEGPVTVTVNDAGLGNDVKSIQDYAGYKVFKGEHTFNYVKDTSVAVVTVKEAKPESVTLAFSKPVKAADLRLFHSAKNAANYQSNVVTTNGKYVDEITFTFDNVNNPVPAGNINLYLVNSETDSNKLVDGYGIKVPDQTLTTNVVVDVTGPTVSSKNVDKNLSIKLTFNEALKASTVKASNFTFKSAKDGKTVYFTVEYPVDGNNKVVKLNVPGLLDDNTEYEVVAKKAIEDLAGNKMENDYVTTFTTGDNTAPTIDKADAYVVKAEGKIYLKFSEPMNEAQMLDKSNYQVRPTSSANYRDLDDDDKLTKISDRMVLIDLDEEVDAPDVKIAPIMDLANKRLNGKVDSTELIGIDVEKVEFKSAELIATNKIKVVFNKQLDTFSNPDISLSGGSITTESAVRIASVESQTVNDDGNTEIVLVLDQDINTDATFTNSNGDTAPISIVTGTTTSSKSVSGTKLGINLSMNIDDKTAPKVAEHEFEVGADKEPHVVIGNFKNDAGQVIANIADQYNKLDKNETAEITIHFTEAMDTASISKLAFIVDGYTVTNVAFADGNKAVIITVKANADNTTVYTSVTQAYNVADTSGNVLASGSTWAVK